ncbi:MAG TPA: hypothetical protein DDX14_08095, partial [Cyanobacteria bacterium UBA9579]|nr:hypothetical protein [Cyanobacteria bacterium UBA9579]
MKSVSDIIINKIALAVSRFVFLIIAALAILIVSLISIFGRKPAHAFIYYVIRPVINAFFPLEIVGKEHLNISGGLILAGNHAGVLDTPLIEVSSKRPVTFFMASWVQSLIVIGWMAKRFQVIPVSRNHLGKAISETIKRLNSGETVCIFPEGTPTSTGKIAEFKRGVAFIHKRSKVPIVPFVIQGGYEAWPWRFSLPIFRKITLQFDKPYCNPEEDEQVITEQLQKRVQYMKNFLEKKEKAELEKPIYDDFLALMQLKFNTYAPHKALSLKEKEGYQDITYTELTRLSNCMSNYLIEKGVNHGDRVAILSESRPEWAVAFFASITSGAVFVPLDTKLTYEELKPLLLNCNPHTICVSSDNMETAKRLKAEIPSVEQIFLLDKSKCSQEYDSLYDLKESADQKNRERHLDDTALIVYTSGTTGHPKGVMVTFRNLISQLKDFDEVFDFASRESLISILPLTHLLEITIGLVTMLYRGAHITYTTSFYYKEFIEMMNEQKVTMLVVVPEFLKIIKRSIERELRKTSELNQRLFHILYNTSRFIPSILLRKMIFNKIHRRLGGNVRRFICGGAPLGPDIAEFFFRIGMPVYEGYGLTETGPVISANTPEHTRLGSVGKPLPSVKVKLSPENEILSKGPNLMRGYYNRPDLTAEAIDREGWFHTGDLGKIDKDGYLYVTGRIKNIIVLSEGTKVQPEEVEELLSKSGLIRDISVVGNTIRSGPKKGTEEVIAVAVPTEEQQQKHKDIRSLKNNIEQDINRLSQKLSPHKRPGKVALSLEDLPKTT